MTLIRSLDVGRELVWCVAVSPDSQLVAAGTATENSGRIRIWQAATGASLFDLAGHDYLVTGLAFHCSGRWLASCSLDGTIRLWDTETGRSLGILHRFDQSVHQLAFSQDGRWLAAACHDRLVALWKFDPHGARPSLPRAPNRALAGHRAPVWAVTWSPDGQYLASGCQQGITQLWQGQTFEQVAKLRGGMSQIRCLSFSADSQLLAGVGYVSNTVLWNLTAIQEKLREMRLDWCTCF